MGNYGCQPFFSRKEILVDWLLEKWNCNDLCIHEFLNIYEKHRQITYMKSWWSIPTGWWFQPLWKILVRLDDHPNYWGKSKMFQTTNQIYIHTSIQFSWTYLCRCMLWARHSMCLNLFFRRPQHKGLATKGMDDMGRNWSPQRSPKIDDQQ